MLRFLALFAVLVPLLAAPTVAYAFDAGSMVKAVNQIRAKKGLPPVRLSSKMQKAAKEQARLMAQKRRMSHSVGRGNSFKVRMKRVGHRGTAAENVAYGQPNAQAALKSWMRSRGHRRNILDKRMKTFGMAVAAGGRYKYWAMVLGQT